MIAPELLLKMFPEQAVRAMIDEKLIRPLRAGHLRLSKPSFISGTRTAVTVSIDKTRAPIDLWDRVGSFTFEYDRLDLGAFTDGLDKQMKVRPPTTPHGILQGLLAPFEIPVVVEDVVDALFTSVGDVTVIAHEESYRWLGEVVVRLIEALIYVDLKLIVRHISIPFDAEFRSATIKSRMTQYLNFANSNALPVVLDDAMFDITKVEQSGALNDPYNTVATLVFKDNPYTGQVDITYPRRAFERTWRKPVQLTGGAFTNKRELASKLSLQMGCEILPKDIKSEPAPTLPVDAVAEFVVSFAPESLAYIGELLVNYRRNG